jgi:ubiquinone/menaquinone biosynthesis C-methylase UbiE
MAPTKSGVTDSEHDAAPSLPDYAQQLTAFHVAFEAELRAAIGALPISPSMKVLDVGCGDGFYTGLLAERLVRPGRVIGLDVDPNFLAVAREQMAAKDVRCQVEFIEAKLNSLPAECLDCDLVWCAQSLYSLPEPVSALRQMAAAVRPGGVVAVLENDTLHQLLLPWPIHLEIAVRAAELKAFSEESRKPSKFYVGRRLPAVFAQAGLEPLGFQTQCIDRQAPLSRHLEGFLESYLQRMHERVHPHIEPKFADELRELSDPASHKFLPRQEWFTVSCVNVLVWGRRPVQ